MGVTTSDWNHVQQRSRVDVDVDPEDRWTEVEQQEDGDDDNKDEQREQHAGTKTAVVLVDNDWLVMHDFAFGDDIVVVFVRHLFLRSPL